MEDAKENARINNITNAEFIVGKAEDVIATRLKSLKQECVAIIGMLWVGWRLTSQILLVLAFIQKLFMQFEVANLSNT